MRVKVGASLLADACEYMCVKFSFIFDSLHSNVRAFGVRSKYRATVLAFA